MNLINYFAKRVVNKSVLLCDTRECFFFLSKCHQDHRQQIA